MTDQQQQRHDVKAEQSVLGAMLMDTGAIPVVVEHCRADDMFQPRHATIMQTILTAWGNGLDVDPIVVAGELDKAGQLNAVGGSTYLLDLVQATPTAANVTYHAKRLADLALVRRIHSAGVGIVQHATEGGDADEILNRAQELIGSVARPVTKDVVTASEVIPTVMDEVMNIREGTPTMGAPNPTGFYELDEVLNGGLRGGQMVIVAARPGVGKSTLAVDIARETTINQGKAALIFSLEMSKEEIVQRVLCAEADIPLRSLRTGEFVGQDDWQRLVATTERIENAKLFLDDAPNLNIMEIRSKARRIAQQNELGLVVVDYLQLLSSPGKVESRQQEVSQFSRQLKLLAKELNVPLIAVSQLNRGVETRGDDAQPRLSDLRESGSLEQDADIVMLIDRPDSRNPDHERAGEADVIVAKHRGGSLGTVTLFNKLQFCKFTNATLARV